MRLDDILRGAGVFQYGTLNTRDVEFTEEVRKYCVDNVCRQYGKTWACPPAVGTVDECRRRAQRYEKMLVFSVKYDLDDSLDFEGMRRGMKDFKKVANRIDESLRDCLSDYLILGNEGCGFCESCTYPGAPCRFPDKSHGSIEGYGIYVSKLAAQVGVAYNNGENTVTYFGALLYGDFDATAGSSQNYREENIRP
jgi:predicted metal-binding protein